MKSFSRGQKSKLTDLGLNDAFAVTIEINASGLGVDVACFGLDANGKLSDDRFMVFYNQTSAPDGAIVLSNEGNRSVFQTNLALLPSGIEKLVFAASIEGPNTMNSLEACLLSIGDAVSFAFSGVDFQAEKAVIIGELYRREGTWRFGAVGQGFAGGLSALLAHFGGAETEAPASPAPASLPPPPPVEKVSLSKITLEKRGDKVSLDKSAGKGFGRVRVNLNWSQNALPPAKTPGLLGKMFGQEAARPRSGIDLDLGCLYELSNGQKNCVQALGEAWGSWDNPPYIQLEADDRTGAVKEGENLFINGAHFDQIKRILIYTFIYEGVPNWLTTEGIVTIAVPGQPPIEVKLDNGANLSMCAIALLENRGGKLEVTKLVEYFSGDGHITAHQRMDERYQFGLRWAVRSKG